MLVKPLRHNKTFFPTSSKLTRSAVSSTPGLFVADMYFTSLLAATLVSVVPHLTSAAPTSTPVDPVSGLAKRYATGWCCVDVIQHHTPNPASDPYTLDIAVKDASGAVIGGSAGQAGYPGQAINQFSMLPRVLLVTVGGADTDPVSFAYAGAHWDSFNGPCVIQYSDSESRQINCGFPC